MLEENKTADLPGEALEGSQLINEIDNLLVDAKTIRNPKSNEIEMAGKNEEAKGPSSKGNTIMPEHPVKSAVNPDAETAMEDGSTSQLSAMNKQILSAHFHNSLDNNSISSAKDLMQKVMYQVPLSRLYSIMASC